MNASLRPLAGWGLALVAALVLPAAVTSPYFGGLLILAAVLAMLAVSVNLVFGYLGYVTFGHAAFLGLGAYLPGLLAMKFGLDYWTLVPLAVVPGAALGALVGFASLRLGGAYFAIASLVVAEILRLVAANWIDVTRGPLGVVVTASPLPFAQPLGWSPQQAHLALALVVLWLVLLVVWRLMRSPYGRGWLAIRESSDLAESIGIPTLRHRVQNIALSGAIAGLAGALLVPKIFVLTPDLFGAHYSATGLLAVILGGKGTLLGPVLGGAIFAILPELLRAIENVRMVVFAGLLLAAILVLPSGLLGRLGGRLRGTWKTARIAGDAPVPTLAFGGSSRDVTPLLEVRDLARSFSGVRAVAGVGFDVRAGEIVGLIGPNGAGKSTCMNLVSGFMRPDAGAVRFAGASLAGLAPHDVARRGLVRTFQHTTLYGSLSVVENVLIATHLAEDESIVAAVAGGRRYREREAARLARAHAALALLELDDVAAARAGDLPYGRQRLLAIALAMAARPSLLLLDEPGAGLNQTEAVRLGDTLRRLRDAGLTLVLIDHNLRLVMSTCDRIVVLHHGEKVAEGTPAQVREHPEVMRAYLGAGATTGKGATHA